MMLEMCLGRMMICADAAYDFAAAVAADDGVDCGDADGKTTMTETMAMIVSVNGTGG